MHAVALLIGSESVLRLMDVSGDGADDVIFGLAQLSNSSKIITQTPYCQQYTNGCLGWLNIFSFISVHQVSRWWAARWPGVNCKYTMNSCELQQCLLDKYNVICNPCDVMRLEKNSISLPRTKALGHAGDLVEIHYTNPV